MYPHEFGYSMSSSRRSNKKMTINDNLPEEIIEDILVKLPPKSILRFQSVSKSWFDLIKSSSFIHKHHVETKTRFLAMCCRNGPDPNARQSRFLSVCLDDDQEEETSVVTQLQKGVNRLMVVCQAPVYKLPFLNFEPPGSYNIFSNVEKDRLWHLIGDCNGILCLTDYKDMLLLNPSLKQVKWLPAPQVACRCHLVGFGFDNLIMDFKVIRLLSLPWKPNEVDRKPRAEVYTLKSNSWRKLDDDDLPFKFFSNNYSVIYPTFFNGVVYWCTSKIASEPGRIRTFNMVNELFGLMEYPQGWDDRIEGIPCSFCLFVLNQESLAFLSNTQPCSSSSDFVNVWTMNEEGTTWTKLYSIGPLTDYLKPMSFLKKDKFLYKTTTGMLILFDLHDHSSSIVCDDVSQLRSHDAFHQLDVCLELKVYKSSLFSINV